MDDPEHSGEQDEGPVGRPRWDPLSDRRFRVEALVIIVAVGVLSVWLLPDGQSLTSLPLLGLILGWRGNVRRRRNREP
ncbi:hypothetical protein [Kitasatospora sp. NPDC057541]|uniref:hypothetical protein n=1 Tax=unclassified Kitasatospora TaxID=2633591 RepID=UPI0036CF68C0